MNKEKLLYDSYLKEKNKLEKVKTKRLLIAIFIIAIIIGYFIYSNQKPKTITEFIELVLVSIILATIDLFIHFIIFKFTIYKNEEDHKKLEKLEHKVYEENNKQ